MEDLLSDVKSDLAVENQIIIIEICIGCASSLRDSLTNCRDFKERKININSSARMVSK